VFAVGGSWLVAPKLLSSGRFDEVTRLAAEAVRIVGQVRGASA
jgi:2-dehydro-3-deoxyphosphogluconate aldolase/(4S)-4-hydroxy-2-oxoglutarate aldolase